MTHRLTITGKEGQEQITLDDKSLHSVVALQLNMAGDKVNEVILKLDNIEVFVDMDVEMKEGLAIIGKREGIELSLSEENELRGGTLLYGQGEKEVKPGLG